MAFPGVPLELMMADARRNPARVPAAPISFGVVLTAAALALIVFKAPGGVFLLLHGGARGYVYYGVLGAVAIFGLAEASFGFWVVPRDVDGWHTKGKWLLWVSLLPLSLVLALGGLAFINLK